MIQLHATRKLFDRLSLNDDGQLADMPWTAKGRGYLWPQRDMLALLEGLSDTAPDAHAEEDVAPDATNNLPDNVVSMSTFRNRRSGE